MGHDLRVKLFCILLGVGYLTHEIEFIYKRLSHIGSFLYYIEKWKSVAPILSIPHLSAVCIHFVLIGLSIALIFSKNRVTIALILLPIAILELFMVPPPGISNHHIMMIFALSAIFMFFMYRSLVIWLKTDIAHGQSQIEASGATLISSLKHILILSYFFAFFQKLNTGWLSASSNTFAGDFLIPYFTPILSLVKMDEPLMFYLLSILSIYSTLIIELILPVLLLIQSTRVLACVAGIIFHILMMARGVLDYPTIIMAFYPLFLQEVELRNILSTQILKFTPGKFYLSLALGGYLINEWRSPLGFFINVSKMDFGWVRLIETIVGYVLIFGWAHVGFSLLWHLLRIPIGTPVVFYDAMCSLCRAEVKGIERLNIGGNLKYENLHESSRRGLNLSKDNNKEKIYVSVNGQAFSGFLAFRVIMGSLGLISFMYPLLYLPGVKPIVESVYNWVVEKKYRALSP